MARTPVAPAPLTPRRWPLRLGIGLLAALLVPVAALLWLLRTEPGNHWLLERVPGLQVQAPEGLIFDDAFSARRVQLSLPGGAMLTLQDIAWRGARWEWLPSPGAWLRLSIDELRVVQAEIQTGPGSDERQQAPSSLRLPVQLDLKALTVIETHIDQRPPLRDLQARVQLGAEGGAQHRLDIHRLQAPALEAQGQLRIAADLPHALEADLRLQAPAGAAERWRAELRAAGPLSSIELRGRLDGSALDKGPAPSLEAQAQIRPFEAWPLGDVSASTRALDLASIVPHAPRTRIQGRALIRSQGLRQPVQADIELDNSAPARWEDGGLPVHALRLSLKADPRQPERLLIGPFDIEAADSRGAAGRWNGNGSWEGAALRLQTRLNDLQPQRLSAALAPMRLSGPLELTLQGLPSPDPRSAGAASWAGWRSLAASLKAELEGHVSGAPQDVQLTLDAIADAQQLQLRSLKARSGAARADLQARLAQREGGRWQLATQGELDAFDPQAWFPGAGGAAWGRGPHRLNARWTADVSAPRRVLGTAWASWLPALQGQAQLRLVDSRLAGVPVSADLELKQTPAETGPQRSRVRGDIRMAGSSLLLEGSGDPQGPGSEDRTRLRLQAPALAELAPLLALLPGAQAWAPREGQAQLQADVRGRWPELTAELQGSASGLKAGHWSLAQAQVQGRMDRGRGDAVALQLELERLAYDGARLDSLKADLRGSLAAHRFEAELSAPLSPPPWLAQVMAWRAGQKAQARVNGQGAWSDAAGGGGRWRAQFDQLLAGHLGEAPAAAAPASAAGAWLDARGLQAELTLAPDGALSQLSLQPGRLSSGQLGLRWTEALWQAAAPGGGNDSWRVQAELEPISVADGLQRLEPAQGTGLSWSGDLKLAAQLSVRAGASFEADLRVQRESGDLFYNDGTAPQALGLTQAELSLRARDGVWRLAPRLQGRMLGRLDGEWILRGQPAERWPSDRAPLEGQVTAQVTSLAAWGGWLPAGWRLQGELDAQAALSGTLGAPGYTGFVKAQRVGLRNLLQGVDLQEGELQIQLQGDTARVERLSIRGGEGRLSAEGTARFGAQPQLQLSARAERLRVLGRVDRQLVLSGQAALAATLERLRLDGRIVADSGLFDLSRRDAPSLDEDVAIVRPDAPEDEAAGSARREPSARMRNAQVALDIDLGQRLRLRGRGIDTLLTGALKLSAPGGRLAVHGSVRTQDGTYAAYGQKLEIERGQVVFAGPLDGARLDILALRPNTDLRVGVAISGAAMDPRVRLVSEPDMAEIDKLSWIVLGRGPEGLGRTDTALLQRAALALLAGEGGGPTDGVLRALGLDEFSIRQTDGEVRETVVSVGKQLSRRWYVGYERGVNATTGTWQLIYRAAQRFTLRAQSGTENSLDLIWTWRFGAAEAR
ncbi:MAG: translocation/assembly module TamB domain-containing protein [Rubrivivax sp.]|nr:translocation/assembly module TamB domain-containing protein [Rubrivivax sp.]